jgi:putative salt-induced outer membrane protein
MKSSRIAVLASLFAAAPALAPAFGQTPPPAPPTPDASKWTGEGALSAGYTTGNTQTTDGGLAIKVKHVGGLWTEAGDFAADYGKTDGIESKNRLAASGQVDHKINDKWNGYTRLTWERDQFSGFDNRYFAGLGLTYKAWDSKQTAWTLEGGPGYKVDEVRAAPATATTPATAAMTERDVGARAASNFRYAFNDRVALTDTSEVVYSDTSTQVSNGLALTAGLMGNLSARVSLDVRHDTSPPTGFKATDTATKFSLVYKVD